MKKKIAVLIPDGEDDRALIVVRSLAYSKQIVTHILSSEYKSVHLSFFCYFHKLNKTEVSDESRLKRLVEISSKHKIEVLLPIGQKGVEFVISNYDYLKSKFKIPPLPAKSVFDIVKDKWTLNKFCMENDLSGLESILIQDIDYKPANLSVFLGPVLLKPKFGEGGLGIKYFESGSILLNELNEKHKFLAGKGYIAQEYIDGEVISFSAYCLDGKVLAHTIHHPAKGHLRSFVFAKVIEFIENEEVLKYGQVLLSKLNWSGIANMDLIRSNENNKIYILDFNPRYFGTMLGTTVSGINYPLLACLKAMGVSFSKPEYEKIIFGTYNGKEIFAWLKDRKKKKPVPFKHTNLPFLLKDPIPGLALNLKKIF